LIVIMAAPRGGAAEHTAPAVDPVRATQFAPRAVWGLDTDVWRFAGLWPRDCARRNPQKPAETRGSPERPRAARRGPQNKAAPLGGAPPRNPRQAWLPSVHLLCRPGWPLPTWPGLTRLPRLVARGYLAAVPGRCCVRTTSSTTKSPTWKALPC